MVRRASPRSIDAAGIDQAPRGAWKREIQYEYSPNFSIIPQTIGLIKASFSGPTLPKALIFIGPVMDLPPWPVLF